MPIKEVLATFISHDWSIFVGLFVIVLAVNAFKASLKIIIAIVVVAIGISILTHLGVIPPIGFLQRIFS